MASGAATGCVSLRVVAVVLGPPAAASGAEAEQDWCACRRRGVLRRRILCPEQSTCCLEGVSDVVGGSCGWWAVDLLTWALRPESVTTATQCDHLGRRPEQCRVLSEELPRVGCVFWLVGADSGGCFVSVLVLAVWILPAKSCLKGRHECVRKYALCLHLSETFESAASACLA